MTSHQFETDSDELDTIWRIMPYLTPMPPSGLLFKTQPFRIAVQFFMLDLHRLHAPPIVEIYK